MLLDMILQVQELGYTGKWKITSLAGVDAKGLLGEAYRGGRLLWTLDPFNEVKMMMLGCAYVMEAVNRGNRGINTTMEQYLGRCCVSVSAKDDVKEVVQDCFTCQVG